MYTAVVYRDQGGRIKQITRQGPRSTKVETRQDVTKADKIVMSRDNLNDLIASMVRDHVKQVSY